MSGLGRFSLSLARPLQTATGPIDRREGFLVRLGDSPAGLGEATPLPGWTESIEDCQTALTTAVESAEPSTVEALPSMRDTPAARHGLELALLDRAARAAGRPLYRQLGAGERVSAVPVNATVGDADIESTVAACRAAADRGFPAVKLKVGARPVEADLDRVAAAGDAVGDRVELRVDANGAWSSDEADTAVERLGRLDVSIVEQPVASTELAALASLRDRGPAIAIDESFVDQPVETIIDADAADLLVLKPMVLGGVGRAVEVAETARSAGLDVYVTTTVDGAVARTAAVHLAAALDVDRACGLATADRLATDVAADPAPVVDGAITVPQAAGGGVSVEDLD